MKPKKSVTSVVKAIKSLSAGRIRKHFPAMKRKVAEKHFWNLGFYVETLSVLSKKQRKAEIEKFIRKQGA